jgi:sugar O-acyltransferase (sialic acid O-acetyltransferase NeuD family)
VSRDTLPHWYIYGAGGLGLETMDILEHAMREGLVPPHNPCFVEDSTARSMVSGYSIHDLSDCLRGSPITIAVGEPRIRELLMNKAQKAGLVLRSIISPTAFVSPMANVGDGVIVAPLCSVQANAKIEANVAVNTMAIVGHDVRVLKGAVISSMVNLGGAVVVGQSAYIGMGALIKEGCSIGEWTIVAMGSVVFSDLPNDIIAVGNPARVSKRNENRQIFK